MAVATEIEVQINQWLDQTEGLIRILATDGNGTPVTPEVIKNLAVRCDWAELEDVSDLLYARQGLMHHLSLEIGWGDPAKAYKGSPTNEAGVFFLNAYKEK